MGLSALIDKKPKSWYQVFELLPEIITYSFLLFCLSYFVFFRNEPIERIYICLNCNNKKYNLKKNMQCQCGGEYVDMDLLKWVEDETTDEQNDNQQEQTPPSNEKNINFEPPFCTMASAICLFQ
jgi:hypothetical protein